MREVRESPQLVLGGGRAGRGREHSQCGFEPTRNTDTFFKLLRRCSQRLHSTSRSARTNTILSSQFGSILAAACIVRGTWEQHYGENSGQISNLWYARRKFVSSFLTPLVIAISQWCLGEVSKSFG